jgi:hypothetical protein
MERFLSENAAADVSDVSDMLNQPRLICYSDHESDRLGFWARSSAYLVRDVTGAKLWCKQQEIYFPRLTACLSSSVVSQ